MKALVIGGGIFGVCAAIELAKSGVNTDLFEKSSDFHAKKDTLLRIF